MPLALPSTPRRIVSDGVALLCDRDAAGSGVTFCFTERAGGVSQQPFNTLNLGLATGDDPARVLENRRRVLSALGAEELLEGLVLPRQVHGDEVVVADGSKASAAALERGCDAVVCAEPGRAVMLLFADCTPVVLTAPRAFAVVHSGWRGTLARIAGKAARVLAEIAGCPVDQVNAVVGPHICAGCYEVSEELAATFRDEFGDVAVPAHRRLDMTACIRSSLVASGADPARIVDCGECTASQTGRFFSHRAEGGRTGRHGAVAFLGEGVPE